MRDVLNRELNRGDCFLKIGRNPKLVIATSISDTKVIGVCVHFKRSPTASTRHPGGRLCPHHPYNDYYNVRYELKFGKVSSTESWRIVKLPALEEFNMGPRIHNFSGSEETIRRVIPAEKYAALQAAYTKALTSCVALATEGKKITVDTKNKYIL